MLLIALRSTFGLLPLPSLVHSLSPLAASSLRLPLRPWASFPPSFLPRPPPLRSAACSRNRRLTHLSPPLSTPPVSQALLIGAEPRRPPLPAFFKKETRYRKEQLRVQEPSKDLGRLLHAHFVPGTDAQHCCRLQTSSTLHPSPSTIPPSFPPPPRPVLTLCSSSFATLLCTHPPWRESVGGIPDCRRSARTCCPTLLAGRYSQPPDLNCYAFSLPFSAALLEGLRAPFTSYAHYSVLPPSPPCFFPTGWSTYSVHSSIETSGHTASAIQQSDRGGHTCIHTKARMPQALLHTTRTPLRLVREFRERCGFFFLSLFGTDRAAVG